LLIRTTDPEGMSDGAIVFNGETTDAALRLDVHAPPTEAERAAKKLAAWITAREFDATVLAREQQNIATEIATTSSRGYTHKWATAAWAQAVRHGAKHVALQGDVDAATPEQVAAYAEQKVALGPSIRIVAVGPMSAADAKKLFEAALPAATSSRAADPAGRAPQTAAAPLAHGELAATWDLPTTQLIEWYLLPDASPADRVAASLLANAVAMKLQTDPELGAARIVALAGADVVLPQGRVFALSASMPDASARAVAEKAFRRALDSLEQSAPGGSLDAYLTMARNEVAGLPDFAAVRKQWGARPNADLVEAQIVLALVARERSSGLSFAEIGAATRALAPKQLLARRDADFAPGKASRLLLNPQK
jgi:hypothetical protein